MKGQVLALALCALVMAPLAGGQSTADLIWSEGQGGRLETWRVLEKNIEDPSTSHQFNSTWLDFSPYDNAVPQSLILLEFSITYTMVLGSDGSWNVTVESDSFTLQDCFWHLTSVNPGGFLSGDFVAYPNYDVQCAAAVVIPEDSVFNVWINRTVLTGSPDSPTDVHITVKGDRGDFIVTSQPNAFEQLTGVGGIEFLAFLAVITLAVVLWSRSKDDIVQMFCGIILGLFGAIAISLHASWVGWVPFGAMLAVLGIYFIIRSVIDWITDKS